MTRIHTLALGVLLAALAISPTARAQQTVARPVGLIPVYVSSTEEGLLLNVLAEPGEQQPGVSCYRHCTFWAVPGNHTLWATNPGRGVNFHLTLDVQRGQNVFRVSSG